MMHELVTPLLMTLFLGWASPSIVLAAENACQEGQDVLGLAVTPLTKQRTEETSGLIVTNIVPLSQGARLGLHKGDVIEQVNSWRARDCQSYSRAVQDARGEQKAVLLLVSRKGRRQTLAFEPEVWVKKEQEQKEQEAVVTLQSMLSTPFPSDLKTKVGNTGEQAVALLREIEIVAVPTNKPNTYELGVANVAAQLRALDQASQGEAEKRIVAGAKVIFGYYLAARDIRQYKQEYVKEERKDLRKGRAAAFKSSSMPYFLQSPVPGWVDRYPFLHASVSESPQMDSILERPGRWDPDQAVVLLWQKAKEETEQFARWLKQ
jgi:membrane-associated protease RseP (regulator of RpoE activity)